ncbi:MAG: hypothetical protein INR64_17630 [Caulobacteraceae bacterium]|nr:hypothetical protein [Caulobacter sp.]
MRRILAGALLALAVLLGMSLGGSGPAEARGRHSMSFSPGDRSRPHAVHGGYHRRGGRSHGRSARHGHGRGRFHAVPKHGAPAQPAARGGDDEGDAAKAVPGKGFTMENGVLTYPAPARFQPKNLPHR